MLTQDVQRQIADDLRQLAKDVQAVTQEFTDEASVSFADLADSSLPESLKPLLQNVKAHGPAKYIYRFELVDEETADACHRAFQAARERYKGKLALARIPPEPSQVMYVGSSKGLASRLAGHLGYGAAKTSSLHLRHWASALEGQFKITVCRFSADLRQELLQTLEDGLWAQERPMFGRQGSR